MNYPRMLVLDLDGTTLDEHGRLAEVDVRAAEQLQAAGVHVTIATGRLFPGTQWVAQALGVKGSVATMNGCEVLDADTGACHDAHYVSASMLAHTRNVLSEHSLSAFLFASRTVHMAQVDARHRKYLQIWSGDLTEHEPELTVEAWSGSDILAIGAAGDHEVVEAARAALVDTIDHPLGAVSFDTYDGDRFLQVLCGNRDKGTALHRLAADRGLVASDVVAVGDWMNDEPMLRVAGKSFAMAHAIPSVKSIADEVLHASRRGGAVAEIARRVWGI